VASGPAIAKRCAGRPEELSDDHPIWGIEAEYLALGLLSIVLIASPERLIVGGGVMDRSSLLEQTRIRLQELLAGYLEAPALGEDIGSYLIRPALADSAGVLGAIALAQTAEM
jgi:fructokinase